jgi:hypothetical protein
MTFRTEFPDYPADAMPAMPAGFVDSSWKNDICPGFRNEKLNLVIYADFPNAADREFPEEPRFTLHSIVENDATGDTIAVSDDWNEVYLAALIRAPIAGLAQAKDFLEALIRASRVFHLEDSPETVENIQTGRRLWTDEEAKLVSARVTELYALPRVTWGRHDCPIGYMMHLEALASA